MKRAGWLVLSIFDAVAYLGVTGFHCDVIPRENKHWNITFGY